MPTWEYAAGVREGWIVEVTLEQFLKMMNELVEALAGGLEASLDEIAAWGNEQFNLALAGTASSS